MDTTLSQSDEIEVISETPTKIKPFFPIIQNEIPRNSNPTSALSLWVSKSVKFLKNKARVPSRISSKRYHFDGLMVKNSVYCDSPNYIEAKMEALESGNEVIEVAEKRGSENEGCEEAGEFQENGEESGDSNLNSDSLASEATLNYENSSSEDSSSPNFSSFEASEEVEKPCLDKRKLEKQGSCLSETEEVEKPCLDKRRLEKQGSCLSETEMMKERFAKLLLGEDMSGCGNGVCTALAISNAITNLCATLFGQIWRLEPLPMEKKTMWRREMNWLLCVSDHIVELIPSWQTFPDGTKLEVMTSRPRADLYVNLPALRKLDNMLLEILESFKKTEFWYVEQGILTPEGDGTSSFRKPLPRQEEKWWLPVPRVQPGGLSHDARRMLQHKRDSTNQILKAAMAINNAALAEMDIPESYLEALPKNGKASLGDIIHRYINSDQFSPECLFDCLDLTSEHQAVEIANKVEATLLLWRQKMKPKPLHKAQRSNSRSSWEMVKDLVSDADKREVLAGRAESLLLCLKQRFPGLPQTTLDMTKIQCNKDVGKSILESYSRVLESLAFNIVARIDDLLYVDDLSKHSDQLISISKVGMISHKTIVPIPTTPFKKTFATPIFSPSHLISPAKVPVRGFGVKRILTEYLNIDGKAKEFSSNMRRSDSFSSTTGEVSTSPSFESSRGSIEVVSRHDHEFVED